MNHSIALFLLLSVALLPAASIKEALEFSQSIAAPIPAGRIDVHWAMDEGMLWYRLERQGGGARFVGIDLESGERREAGQLERLGIPPLAPFRSSEVSLRSGRSQNAGGRTDLTVINEMDQPLKLVWLDWQGRRKSFGALAGGQSRTVSTFAGHFWMVLKADGKPVSALAARARPTRWIIDTPSARPEPGPRRRSDDQSPDGRFKVVNRPSQVELRQLTLIESRPEDQVQPKLKRVSYPKPGDALPEPKLLVEDSSGELRVVERRLFPRPYNTSGHIRVRWAPDSSEFYFDYNQRGHQLYRIIAADPLNGKTRTVVEERAETFIDYTTKCWRHWLDSSGELLWMSERDGFAHLYRIEISSGKVLNQITRGDWVVREVLRVDPERRRIWFMAGGQVEGENPCQRHLCRVGFDGEGLVRLTEGDGDHRVQFSPDRRYFVDSWSRPDLAPVHELRESNTGRLVAKLEQADLSGLIDKGWSQPERFHAKGRDGSTDIHGVIIKPIPFDPEKSYPVVEDIYAGPHGSFAPTGFSRLRELQLLARLGFVVVKLDGMGTNHRGKRFHDLCWKNLKDSGFPDRRRWIQAAAKSRPWMDLKRIGIFGNSAGGQSAMRAVLDHADFYRVAVAGAGCHDNRMDKIWWNEQWMGWPLDDSYLRSSNVEDAHKLGGKLMLIVGELDSNVDPASTYQVVHALQQANKDFEYLFVPGAGHGAMGSRYVKARWLRFLVENLQP